jgi:hypothetical protein
VELVLGPFANLDERPACHCISGDALDNSDCLEKIAALKRMVSVSHNYPEDFQVNKGYIPALVDGDHLSHLRMLGAWQGDLGAGVFTGYDENAQGVPCESGAPTRINKRRESRWTKAL